MMKVFGIWYLGRGGKKSEIFYLGFVGLRPFWECYFKVVVYLDKPIVA